MKREETVYLGDKWMEEENRRRRRRPASREKDLSFYITITDPEKTQNFKLTPQHDDRM